MIMVHEEVHSWNAAITIDVQRILQYYRNYLRWNYEIRFINMYIITPV